VSDQLKLSPLFSPYYEKDRYKRISNVHSISDYEVHISKVSSNKIFLHLWDIIFKICLIIFHDIINSKEIYNRLWSFKNSFHYIE